MAAPPDTIRNLNGPLRESDLAPLGPRCREVILTSPLEDAEYRRLGAMIEEQPRVLLRIVSPQIADLEFLRFFPALRRLHFDLFGLRSSDGLQHLSPDLTYLGWGPTRSGRLTLKVLSRFIRLQQLNLETQQRDLAVLAELRQLRQLSLRSVHIEDLSILLPLRRLRRLQFLLGGNLDLAPLAAMTQIESLALLRVRGLADLSPIAAMTGLQELSLHDLPKVTALPPMSRLTRLRYVEIQNLKALVDLSPLGEAPALEELRLFAMRHSNREALAPLLARPNLRQGLFLLGTDAKNAEARRRYGHREPADD